MYETEQDFIYDPTVSSKYNIAYLQYLTPGTSENEVLQWFIKTEAVDFELFGVAIPQIATKAYLNMKNNYPVDTDELLRYLSFYNNDANLILELRSVVIDGIRSQDVNEFLKSVYVKSRQQHLTRDQLDCIRCSRELAHLDEENLFIWESLPTWRDLIADGNFSDYKYIDKVRGVVDSGITKNYLSTKQFYVLRQFKNYLEALETSEDAFDTPSPSLVSF